MILNGKQKRYLRALAVNEKALVHIGKDGLSDNIIQSIKEVLKARELVKISILKSCTTSTNELLIEILSNTVSHHVQTIGRNIILYKQSKERLIKLP